MIAGERGENQRRENIQKKRGKEWICLQNVCLWKEKEELMKSDHKVIHPDGNASGC